MNKNRLYKGEIDRLKVNLGICRNFCAVQFAVNMVKYINASRLKRIGLVIIVLSSSFDERRIEFRGQQFSKFPEKAHYLSFGP